LIELLGDTVTIANGRDMLNVHLPLDSKFLGRVIGLRLPLLLGRGHFAGKPKSTEHPVKGTGVPGIPFVYTKFPIQFAYRDVGVAPAIITDPLQFLLSVSIRMWRERSMRFVSEGISGIIETLIPTHERGFGDFVPPADKRRTVPCPIEFDSIESSVKSMW
jgi:hypothetical protein